MGRLSRPEARVDPALDGLLWLALRDVGSRFAHHARRPGLAVAAADGWLRLTGDVELTAGEKIERLVGLLVEFGVPEWRVRGSVERDREAASTRGGARRLRARLHGTRRQQLAPGWRPFVPKHKEI